ncbi:F-box protein [Aspergillus fijiensis CBS 313.89]|uniref:F-box domain-containing protein n=1 Tax=Aspergillus fijiensis CBS 313.89 TaxID=1448319 RepID=A0A8G1RXX7_9EURO|nr:uncharacterized protein BO72DRAFT_444770 [Aspergillus fijiensis CBS 313.89]RAK81249.1 hypothetical protein BO72DRAFT_444770 [Aspergillus fijiensis CBS 313.89]
MSFIVLPSELVTEICGYLKLADWCALRLTCRTFYLRSSEAFVNFNFQTICVLITSEGLSRLAAIAADENIRTRVKDLWIVPTLFEGSLEKKYLPVGNTPPPLRDHSFPLSLYARGSRAGAERFNRFTVYQAIVADHCHVLSTRTFGSVLRRSLACFKNLDGIGLRSCPTWVLLDAAQPADFPCLGVRQLRRQIPCHGIIAPSVYLWHEKTKMGDKNASVFSTVVNAIVTAQRELRRLKTCDRRHCGVAAQDLTTLTMTPEYKRFLPLLQNLETLHLCFCGTDQAPTDYCEEDCLRGTLEMVVAAAPSLRTLDLSFCYEQDKRLSSQIFSQLAPRVHFTQLRNLDLHSVDTTHSDLQAFLRPAATTLQRLTLSSVNLVEAISRLSTLNAEPHSAEKQQWILDCRAEIARRWRAVWASLHDDMPSLRYLCMDDLLFHGYKIHLSDPLSAISGVTFPTRRTLKPRVPPTNSLRAVAFEADHAQVPLGKWIRGLDAHPSEPASSKLFSCHKSGLLLGPHSSLPGSDSR